MNDQIENNLKFYKKKIKNSKNKDQIRHFKKSKDNSEILHGQTRFSREREKKVGEKKTIDALP